jgi:hypothetical protein
LDLNLRKKLVKYYMWSIALCGAETWTLCKVDQKYLESFEMCCRKMKKISWTNCVRNEEALQGVKKRTIVQTIKRRKANWIGHILRRNCHLKHVIEGKMEGRIEVTRRRGRRELLKDLKEKRRYWKLREEALDHTVWRTWFGRDCGPVRRQTE